MQPLVSKRDYFQKHYTILPTSDFLINLKLTSNENIVFLQFPSI